MVNEELIEEELINERTAEMSQYPVWRLAVDSALNKADDANTASFVQLATLDGCGKPSVRTMVCRGFTDDSSAMLMATDLRSDKVAQHKDKSCVQVVWYFTTVREQFRFSGMMDCLTIESADQSTRLHVWKNLSDRARLSFFDAIEDQPTNLVEPGENFVVLKVVIDEVEQLDLKSELQQPRHFEVISSS